MANMGAEEFPRQVLIVDDEQTVLDVLTVVLKKHGLASRTATSAEQAIALLRADRFGCVLTDKNLPGQSGLDVIREAKALHPSCACLVMTGYPSAESLLAAMRAGATDYLEKPFTELKLVVQKIESEMDHARTSFERAALAQALREMQATLKQNEEQSFKQQTELDVFAQVLELRIEEATRELTEKNKQLQAGLHQLRDQVLQVAGRVGGVSDELKVLASRAGTEASRPAGTLEDARTVLTQLAAALAQASDHLRM